MTEQCRPKIFGVHLNGKRVTESASVDNARYAAGSADLLHGAAPGGLAGLGLDCRLLHVFPLFYSCVVAVSSAGFASDCVASAPSTDENSGPLCDCANSTSC